MSRSDHLRGLLHGRKRVVVIGIGSNIASLSAQRSLADATDKLSSTFERLSSGLRINRASDDAAGLSVADSLRNRRRLYSAAMRNVSDGLSSLAIASGSLESQSSMITRMIELAEQASNGSLSSTQRATLQKEYYQLTKEFARTGASSSFNGLALLLGSNRGGVGNLNLQAGIDGSRNSNIGVTLGDSGELSGIIDRTNLMYTSSDIAGAPYNSETTLRDMFRMGVFHLSDTKAVTIFENGSYGTYSMFVYAKNSDGSYTETSEHDLTYNAQTGEIDSAVVATLLAVGVDVRALRLSDSTGQYGPNLGLGTNIEFTGITTQTTAQQSLVILQSRLQALAQLKGSIGASESRLKTAMAVNATQEIESAASESRIRDVDVASEASTLIATQIRQQLATKILQSANLQPKIALDLLRN